MYRQQLDFTGEVSTEIVIRVSDGACIPICQENIDYQEYAKWCAKGNTVLPPEE